MIENKLDRSCSLSPEYTQSWRDTVWPFSKSSYVTVKSVKNSERVLGSFIVLIYTPIRCWQNRLPGDRSIMQSHLFKLPFFASIIINFPDSLLSSAWARSTAGAWAPCRNNRHCWAVNRKPIEKKCFFLIFKKYNRWTERNQTKGENVTDLHTNICTL